MQRMLTSKPLWRRQLRSNGEDAKANEKQEWNAYPPITITISVDGDSFRF